MQAVGFANLREGCGADAAANVFRRKKLVGVFIGGVAAAVDQVVNVVIAATVVKADTRVADVGDGGDSRDGECGSRDAGVGVALRPDGELGAV